MLTDEAWIRGEIECCDLYPCDHSRMMKAALLELLAARALIREYFELDGKPCPAGECKRCDAIRAYKEGTR